MRNEFLDYEREPSTDPILTESIFDDKIIMESPVHFEILLLSLKFDDTARSNNVIFIIDHLASHRLNRNYALLVEI